MAKKMTTAEFIARAKEVHGNKYDYSKTEYVDVSTKVCIVCPEHGEFWQNPYNHLKGCGCAKCASPNYGMTTEMFVEKSREIYGDKYDYSKVVYKKMLEKVCIICPEHGEFWQTPLNHLEGSGCPKCSGRNKTTEDFIAKARKVHGNKYDYSKVVYKNATEKVCIICPEHGEFWQNPTSHLKGFGCRKCSAQALSKKVRKDTTDFIAEAKTVHGDKYDYSKVEYVNSNTKVCIICPEHGEFWQSPSNHLKGKGCPKCIGRHKSTEDFIASAKKVHGDKYDYSKTEYVNASTKVCVICPEHGEFWQDPNSHLAGRGCPKCVREVTSLEDFLAKAKRVHGDKYDYSKVEYVNATTKVCIICPEHGEFWQTPNKHLGGSNCPKCVGGAKFTKEDFVTEANKVHNNKYDYSKVEYVNANTKVCIVCPEHGEFWQTPGNHLAGAGCPNCQGLRKEYKFNLLEEFIDEFRLRDFLMTNDENMIYIILRNIEKIEPKFSPIAMDIDRALRADSNDPVKDLEDKYRKPEEETANTNETTTVETAAVQPTATSIQSVDLDDDDAVEAFVNNTTEGEKKDEKKEPTIEDLTKARETEIKIINEIEHMLTPEDRQFIKDKFLNDRRREWMKNRDRK